MLYTNAYIYTAERRFLHGGFRVEGGRFAAVFTEDSGENGNSREHNTANSGENGAAAGQIGTAAGERGAYAPYHGEAVEDLGGAVVLPGLVDIHTHGCAGADFSDGSLDGLRPMGAWYLRHGVTSFAPASMTLPYDALARAFQTAVQYREAGQENRGGPAENGTLSGCTGPENCARLAGIYMEGPFLSRARRGAQNPAYLRAPDFAAFRDLYEGCGGLIRVVCAAPELDGAGAFAQAASRLCTVSAAHTDADYATAAAFFDRGASHLTHLFNAMTPVRHRGPGVIGAAAERENVTAELICDGFHVHPAAVRMAFKLFPGRLCLISDSLRCAGMPDGDYTLGGQNIFLRQGRAALSDGTLAGSAVSLFDALRNAVAFGIPPEEAVAAATIVPAHVIRRDREIGSIEPLKRADFLVCEGIFLDKEEWSGPLRDGQFLRNGQFPRDGQFRLRRAFLGGREAPGSGEGTAG